MLLEKSAGIYEASGEIKQEVFQRTLNGNIVIITVEESFGVARTVIRHTHIAEYVPIDFP